MGSAFAAAFAVFAVAGPVLADTPEGWDSWPEAQPFRVGLRVTGFFTLVFLVLLYIEETRCCLLAATCL
jgi:hypothetical protein